MNPAALKTNLEAVETGGTVIVNEDAFTDSNLRKAGYASNPLDDDSLSDYQVFRVPMTSITVRATERIEVCRRVMPRVPRTSSPWASYRGSTAGPPR